MNVRAFLARHAVLLIVLAALAVRLPALGWDFFVDDHGLMLVVERAPEHPTLRPWSLFDFGGWVDPASAGAEDSALPWWTDEGWKVRFFRPIPSLLHALDWRLFGRATAAHHAVSLAWLALLLVLLQRFYLAAGLAPRLAAWALAVFAFEDGSLMPTCWLANRNTLIETTFTVLALLCALRGSGRAAWFGAYVAALGACLSKESGVAAPLGVAALLWLRAQAGEAGRGQRRAALAGLALAAGYAAFLLGSGYGTQSEFYLTPWGDPLAFARRGLELLALGTFSAFGPFAVDTPMHMGELYAPWMTCAFVFGGALALVSFRAARGLELRGFFVGWVVLTLLPQAGALPSDRLLFLPMVGAAPLIASFASRAFAPKRWPIRWPARVAPALVALLCIPLGAAGLLAKAVFFRGLIDQLNAAAVSYEVPRDGTRCEAFVLQAGSEMNLLAPDPVWVLRTGIDNVRIHPLQCGRRALRIERVDERTLDIESLGEAFLTRPFEIVFRSSEASPSAGSVRRHRGFSVEVLRAEERGPRALRVRFDSPPDQAPWRVLTWRDGAFRALALPPPGATLDLPEALPLHPYLP